MKKIPLIAMLMVSLFSAYGQQNKWLTPYEKGNKNQTATYQEAIDFYIALDNQF